MILWKKRENNIPYGKTPLCLKTSKKKPSPYKGMPEEIYDRFCRDMTFGTSGLRGKMGIGTNRINEIVIKRATMGVADYLLSKHEKPKVVIGYDTRKNSAAYAEETARTLLPGA